MLFQGGRSAGMPASASIAGGELDPLDFDVMLDIVADMLNAVMLDPA